MLSTIMLTPSLPALLRLEYASKLSAVLSFFIAHFFIIENKVMSVKLALVYEQMLATVTLNATPKKLTKKGSLVASSGVKLNDMSTNPTNIRLAR
jgi:hypothetical protein